MKSESFRKQALSLVLFFAAVAAVFALTRLRSDPAKKQAEFVVQQLLSCSSAVEQAVEQVFDLRPTAIIRDLDLRKPIYRQLAAYGHMGREDLGVTWERTDRVDQLKAALNLR